jgi:Ca2+:H+ antiporter
VTTALQDTFRLLRGSWLNVLLVLVPVSVALHAFHAPQTWVFVASALAIVPLAGAIGEATEATADHTGPEIGGFLNATFGNAPELIIALFAVRAHLFQVVKASIIGSILGNMLLVLGAAMIAGGWGRDRQRFSSLAARSSVGMLMLAVTALVMPAVWELVVVGKIGAPSPAIRSLSFLTAIVLLLTYAASLVFSLVTHRDLFRTVTDEAPARAPEVGLPGAIATLLAATLLTAWMSEILVGAVESAALTLHLTELFIGVIVVAVIGNAAEHFTAVVVARRGRMNLGMQIALGSSAQVALLVAPVLVLASFAMGQPMDLAFSPFEIAALALAVISVAFITLDGEANWFKGVQLVAVYILLALAFYFVPQPPVEVVR